MEGAYDYGAALARLVRCYPDDREELAVVLREMMTALHEWGLIDEASFKMTQLRLASPSDQSLGTMFAELRGETVEA